MLTRRAALILRLHATLLFFLAIAFLLQPRSVAQFMGLDLRFMTSQMAWSFRLTGTLLLPIALLAPLTAAFAGERGLRQASAGMAAISIGVAVVIAIAPIGMTAGKIVMVAAWLCCAAGYVFALRGRGRNR